jgi:phosphoglycolate phosphatase
MSMYTPLPSAILFDWDGTLADSLPLIHTCLNAALGALGRTPWTLEQVQKGIHRSARESFPALFGERWEEAYRVYYETFEALHMEKIAALEGATRLLETVHGQGIPMAVVSNKQGKYLRKEVEYLGWNPYFRAVIGAGDAVRDKPDTAPAQQALAVIEQPLSPAVWFVGDSITDMECAHNGGMTAVLLRKQPPEQGEFLPCLPHLVAPNCHALTEILEKNGITNFTKDNCLPSRKSKKG